MPVFTWSTGCGRHSIRSPAPLKNWMTNGSGQSGACGSGRRPRPLSTYPEVQLEIWVDVGRVDIVTSGFDAAIGPKDWVASDMIGVRVTGPIKIALVGAPTYFAGRRSPRAPDDLASHNCIQYRVGAKGPLAKWHFQRNGKSRAIATPGRLTVNNTELALRAALD